MEENVNFYGHTIEEKLLDKNKSIRISCDTEDLDLIIDLDTEHQKIDLSNSNKINYDNDDHSSDDMSIGCEENETSVNFYIKAEKTQLQIAKKSSSNNACIKSELKYKPNSIEENSLYNEQKQNSLDKNADVKNSFKIPKLPSKQCDECDFEADLVKDLHEHITNAHKKEYVNCPECPFKTKRNFFMRKHAELHSSKNPTYKCSVCTFGTNLAVQYNHHIHLHTNNLKKEKKNKFFFCPLCSFSSSYLKTMIHFRIHATDHEYLENIVKCPMCGMKTKNSLFHKHSKHHIVVKPPKLIKEDV